MILTKAALVKMYSEDMAKCESDKSIFNNLASVSFHRWSFKMWVLAPSESDGYSHLVRFLCWCKKGGQIEVLSKTMGFVEAIVLHFLKELTQEVLPFVHRQLFYVITTYGCLILGRNQGNRSC